MGENIVIKTRERIPKAEYRTLVDNLKKIFCEEGALNMYNASFRKMREETNLSFYNVKGISALVVATEYMHANPDICIRLGCLDGPVNLVMSRVLESKILGLYQGFYAEKN